MFQHEVFAEGAGLIRCGGFGYGRTGSDGAARWGEGVPGSVAGRRRMIANIVLGRGDHSNSFRCFVVLLGRMALD